MVSSSKATCPYLSPCHLQSGTTGSNEVTYMIISQKSIYLCPLLCNFTKQSVLFIPFKMAPSLWIPQANSWQELESICNLFSIYEHYRCNLLTGQWNMAKSFNDPLHRLLSVLCLSCLRRRRVQPTKLDQNLLASDKTERRRPSAYRNDNCIFSQRKNKSFLKEANRATGSNWNGQFPTGDLIVARWSLAFYLHCALSHSKQTGLMSKVRQGRIVQAPLVGRFKITPS